MMTTTTTTTETTARKTSAIDGRPSLTGSAMLALAFAASMALALGLAGVVTATLAGSMPAGPGGLALMLAVTFGTIGGTLALTRRAFLSVVDAV